MWSEILDGWNPWHTDVDIRVRVECEPWVDPERVICWISSGCPENKERRLVDWLPLVNILHGRCFVNVYGVQQSWEWWKVH